MREFDYVASYHQFVVPAFRNFNEKQKEALSRLLPEVKERQQTGKALTIPMNEAMNEALQDLSCQEIAELSRCCYYAGHWQPSKEENLFPINSGQGWKVANVCDQVLRSRLNPQHNIQIHEGKFRVTFSNSDCWTWKEFALATEKNLEAFRNCGLSFGRNTLETSAKRLAELCGDLWETLYKHTGKEYNNDEIPALLKPLSLKLFKVLKADHVNFKPHPFMITGYHLSRSKGGVLNPDCAPCGFSGCQLKYAEHTSEKALFLAPLVEDLESRQAEVKAELQTIIDELQKYDVKLDGFGLVKG